MVDLNLHHTPGLTPLAPSDLTPRGNVHHVPHRHAPRRTIPHRTTPHHTAPHRTTPRRAASRRIVPSPFFLAALSGQSIVSEAQELAQAQAQAQEASSQSHLGHREGRREGDGTPATGPIEPLGTDASGGGGGGGGGGEPSEPTPIDTPLLTTSPASHASHAAGPTDGTPVMRPTPAGSGPTPQVNTAPIINRYNQQQQHQQQQHK